jgi:hypothetical protein
MDQMNPLPNAHMDDMDVTMAPKVIIHDDHEVAMARAQVYRCAKNAMEIHKLLKMVDNLEGWMQAKITMAADYLEAVASNLEYDVVSATMMESAPVLETKSGKYEVDATHNKYREEGLEIITYQQNAKFKPEPGMSKKEKAAAEDEFFKLMNDFSKVGDKMTRLGTDFEHKGLTKKENDIRKKALEMIAADSADLKKKEITEATLQDSEWSKQRNSDWKLIRNAILPPTSGQPTSTRPKVSPETDQKRKVMKLLLDHGFARDQAGEIADALMHTGVMPRILPKFIRSINKALNVLDRPEDTSAHQMQIHRDWISMLMNPRKGKSYALNRAQAGEIAQALAPKGIAPVIPLYEDKLIPPASEFRKDQEIKVMDASGGPQLNLGDLEDMGVGKISRKQPGYKGTGFGFKYFEKDAAGNKHKAVIDLGYKKMLPGDEFFDEY